MAHGSHSSSYGTLEPVQQSQLGKETGTDGAPGYVQNSDEEADQSSVASSDVQTGVKKIEAISSTWTKWSLIFAYVG